MSALLPWSQAMGWALLHFLWQGALIAGAYGLWRGLLPARSSALRYGLGVAALVVSALCVPLTVWWLSPDVEPVLGLGNAHSQPMDDGASHAADLAGLMPWLAFIWVLGVVLSGSRAVIQWRMLDRIVTSMAVRNADLDRIMGEVLARFHGMREVLALVSPQLDTPTLIGWIKPVIVLPSALLLSFPRQHLELILIHELGHLRRYDHLVNLGQVLIETLLFYHPAVHWMSREVRHDREVRCDELVLGMCQGEGRAYATALAALEDLRQASPRLSLAASGGSLLDRIRRIVGSPQPNRGSGTRRWATWAPALAGVVTAAAMLLHVHEQQRDADKDNVSAPVAMYLPKIDGPPLRIPPHELETDLPPISWPEPVLTALPIVANRNDRSEPVTERLEIDSAVDQALRYPDRAPSVAQSGPLLSEPALRPPAEIATGTSNVASNRVPGMTPLPTSPEHRRDHPAPRLLHRVAPTYPGVARAQSRGTVELEFSIDANGAVHDIAVVSVDTPAALLRSARHALRQWRFEPGSGAEHAAERLRQEFVFAGVDLGSGADAEQGEARCIRSTGSKLCRSPRASDEVKMQIVPKIADASQVLHGTDTAW